MNNPGYITLISFLFAACNNTAVKQQNDDTSTGNELAAARTHAFSLPPRLAQNESLILKPG